MHVLVATCVHIGDDARILQRQIRSLLAAGHDVTYIAPPVTDPPTGKGVFRHVEVPRARGRNRVRAWSKTRTAVKRHRREADILIVHDHELMPLLAFTGPGPLVWDVHEDTPAAVAEREWIPAALRPTAGRIARAIERIASRRAHLMLAERSYVERMGDHPIIPNTTWVDDVPRSDCDGSVVYIGRLSAGRGLATMLEVGRLLEPGRLVLIGPVDSNSQAELDSATRAGYVDWRGPRPNPETLRIASRALAGLSLLRDEPNYRHSMPTKIYEYLALGIPAITTPLPAAADVVERSRAGFVVPFDDADAVVEAVTSLDGDPEARDQMGGRGREAAAEDFSWDEDGRRFVELIERWARPSPTD